MTMTHRDTHIDIRAEVLLQPNNEIMREVLKFRSGRAFRQCRAVAVDVGLNANYIPYVFRQSVSEPHGPVWDLP